MKHLLLTTIAAVVLVGCGEALKKTSDISMGEWLKESMQEQLNLRHSQLPASTIFDMIKPKVLEVAVVRGGFFSNTHKGIAKVQYKGNVYNVVVTITADGESAMWEAPPGSFLFLAQ